MPMVVHKSALNRSTDARISAESDIYDTKEQNTRKKNGTKIESVQNNPGAGALNTFCI